MSERRAAYRVPPSRTWRWECHDRMHAYLVALRKARGKDAQPGIDKRPKIVPTRMTERAVDDSGVPRMSGELLAYLDAPEPPEADWWRALYAWSPAHGDLYQDYLDVLYAGAPHKPLTDAEMTNLGQLYDRAAGTIRKHLQAINRHLHATVHERQLADIAQRREESVG